MVLKTDDSAGVRKAFSVYRCRYTRTAHCVFSGHDVTYVHLDVRYAVYLERLFAHDFLKAFLALFCQLCDTFRVGIIKILLTLI